MKYLLILGRGIEGAGNTRNAIDYSLWLNKNGHEAKVIAFCDKHWVRTNAHSGCKDFKKYRLSCNLDDILKEVDWAEGVLVLSVPIKKCDDTIKDNFMKVIDYIKDKNIVQAYFQLDHNIISIYRNFYADERYYRFLSEMDVIFTHSIKNDFCNKFIKDRNIPLKNLVTRSNNIPNIFGIDFDLMRQKYWQPVENKEKKTVRFIGRAAIWKGPWILKDIHTKYLKADGYITYLEGIEMALHSIQYIFKTLHPRVYDDNVISVLKPKDGCNKINNGTYVFERNKPIYLLPPYKNDLCMKRLAKTSYGCELLSLKDYFLVDVIENAMLEMVAVGAIPVFRKHWAELFTVGGKTMVEWGEKETGTLFLDENNPEPTIKKMDAIEANPALYDKMRENAYSFYKRFFDADVVCNAIFSEIDKVAKKKNG